MTVPYEELDSGIRATVRWLNENGFRTTDSGDGRSKYANGDECAMDCAMPFPNVAILTNPSDLATECERLSELLRERGIPPVPMGSEIEPGNIHIQGSYDPTLESDVRSFILLFGLDDSMLPPSRSQQVED